MAEKERLTNIGIHVTGKMKMEIMRRASARGESMSKYLSDLVREIIDVPAKDDEQEAQRTLPKKQRKNPFTG